MTWARFDDRYLDNPKIVNAGAWGMRLHMASIIWHASCWQKQQGIIPRNAIKLLAAKAHIPDRVLKDAIASLISNALWDENASDGWVLHNWEKYLRPEDRDPRVHARPVPVPVPSRQEHPTGVLASPVESLSLLSEEEQNRIDVDLQVFIVWQECADKPTAKFLPKRRQMVRERRKEGYTQEDLLDAVRGWENDDWDRRKYRNAIEDLISSGPRLERFRDFYRNGRPMPQMAKPNGASARASVYRDMANRLEKTKLIKEA